eukprot:1104884_1
MSSSADSLNGEREELESASDLSAISEFSLNLSQISSEAETPRFNVADAENPDVGCNTVSSFRAQYTERIVSLEHEVHAERIRAEQLEMEFHQKINTLRGESQERRDILAGEISQLRSVEEQLQSAKSSLCDLHVSEETYSELCGIPKEEQTLRQFAMVCARTVLYL